MKQYLFYLTVSLLLLINKYASAQQLKGSVQAPNIVTQDVLGNKVNLQKVLLQKEKVLICFLRPVWCPICNYQTHQLIKRYSSYQKRGIEVIAIYPNEQAKMRDYVKDKKIPFTVIADPDEKLYKLYGTERSLKKYKAALKIQKILDIRVKGNELFEGKEYAKRVEEDAKIINADFIIGKKRIVEVAHYGAHAGDHYDLDKVK